MSEIITHEPGEVDSHEHMGAFADFQAGKQPEATLMTPEESIDMATQAAQEEDAE